MNRISKSLGVAIIVVLIFSAFLTICFLFVIDAFTFNWQSKSFEKALAERIIIESRSFQIQDIDEHGCFQYKEKANQGVKLCPSVRKERGEVWVDIDAIKAGDTLSYRLAQSNYNLLFGRSKFVGKGKEIQDQVFRLGYEISELEENEAREDTSKSGFRWLQSIIEVLKSSSRSNTRLVGWVQLLIYFFSMIAIALMIVDISFVKKNQKILKDISFFKIKQNNLIHH